MDSVCSAAPNCSRYAGAGSDANACYGKHGFIRDNHKWLALLHCAKLHRAQGCYSEMGLQGKAKWSCVKPSREYILNSLVAGLAAEGRIHNGAWLDAGAETGEWPLYYGCLLAARAPVGGLADDLHTFDVNRGYVDLVRRKAWRYENVHAHHSILASPERAEPDHPSFLRLGREPNMTRVSIDSLFQLEQPNLGYNLLNPMGFSLHNSQFAFGHFDVESWELEVLRGGIAS